MPTNSSQIKTVNWATLGDSPPKKTKRNKYIKFTYCVRKNLNNIIGMDIKISSILNNVS